MHTLLCVHCTVQQNIITYFRNLCFSYKTILSHQQKVVLFFRNNSFGLVHNLLSSSVLVGVSPSSDWLSVYNTDSAILLAIPLLLKRGFPLSRFNFGCSLAAQ